MSHNEIMRHSEQRPSTTIPLILIQLADEHDVYAELNRIPAVNFERDRTCGKRHNSCPPDFLTVPTDNIYYPKRKLEAMRPLLPIKDLSKEIGMQNILNTIEKRKIKQKRRSRRRLDNLLL